MDRGHRSFVLFVVISSFSFMICSECRSQANSYNAPAIFHPGRLKSTVIAESILSTAIFTGLHYLWYKKYPHSRFHFFNDNGEWLQMDKAGHATTAYNVSAFQYYVMRQSGISNRSSTWIGGLTALGFQTIIEIFDGFSQKWGFSVGDMLANIIGTSVFMAQQFAWNQQKLGLKFSFHSTIFPQYNPAELGKNKWQRWLKDYNGQTYWLTLNPSSFMKSGNDFPKWLNLAAGYGAEGMIGASSNPTVIGDKQIPTFTRTRKYYLSIDADINRFHQNNQFPYAFPNILKFPAPAIEFKKSTTARFTPFYF